MCLCGSDQLKKVFEKIVCQRFVCNTDPIIYSNKRGKLKILDLCTYCKTIGA